MTDDEGIEEVEKTMNQKLKEKRKLKDALGISYVTVGRHYNKLTQNIAEQFWIWFHDNKGWRAVITGIAIFFGLALAYLDFPQLLLVVVTTPVLIVIGEIGAHVIIQKRMKVIKSMQVESKAVPYSVHYDIPNQTMESILLEAKITGFHDYKVFDDAISENPKPGSIQIVGGNVSKDYITNQEGVFVEYVSDDGMFAAGNPFTGYGNYSLLEAYQDPKYVVSEKYEKLLKELETLPKTDPELIDNIKVLNAHFHNQVKALKNTASVITDMLHQAGVHIKSIGYLDIHSQKFLTRIDVWKTPWFKKYSEYMKMPEVTRRAPLINLVNMAGSLNNMSMSMKLYYSMLYNKAWMAIYEADIKIRSMTIDQMLQTSDIDSKKLESPIPVEMQREVLKVREQVTDDGEEEDEW